jgi:PPP family 3-phenylpropionic acid transporter
MRNLSIFYFLFYLALSTFSPYLTIYLSSKGLSATFIGLLLSLWALVSVISQPILGMINDRLNDQRKLLMISTVISPVIALGFYYFNGHGVLLLIAALYPLFQAASGPISDSIAVEAANQQGFTFAGIRLWGALSYALGAFCTSFYYEKYGYEYSFFVTLIISFFVLIALFFIPRPKSVQFRFSFRDQAKQVYLNKPFMTFVGISFLFMMAITINMNFLPIYFKNMSLDKAWIGTAFSIAAITEIPIFWLSIKLNQRIGHFRVLCIAAACFAFKCLILSMFHNLPIVLAMQIFDGISFALFISAAIEIVDSFSSQETKAAYQTVFAAISSGLGGVIGNSVGGIIVDQLGAAVLYLVMFGLCFAASAFFIAFPSLFRNRNFSIPG